MSALSIGTPADAWKVFLLFTIPVGGGIPAGVLLGQNLGIGWITMSFLYLVSDMVLACLFEPIMLLLAYAGRKIHALEKLRAAFRKSTERTLARYGGKPGPLMLVAIAFGVDPMTGRAAALAIGHGFITGWTIAIIGDMLFFFIIMSSTIWLNNILGDGTVTAIIIMVAMMILPSLIRRIRAINSPML